MTSDYRRLRWIVFAVASLFLLLVETQAVRADGLGGKLFWHVLLYGGILVFTLAVFGRLEQMQQRVDQQSAGFRALFEATGLGILMIGPDCVITQANHSAEQLTGFSRADLVGRRACAELLFRPDGGPLGCPGLCAHAALADAAYADGLTPLRLRQKAGTEIPIMASVAPLGTGEQPRGYAYLMWDISERTRLEAAEARRHRQAEGLREIGLEIAGLSDLKGNMARVLQRARDLFCMDLVAWGILDETEGTITWKSASGTGSPAFPGTVLSVGGTVMGRILIAGRPFVTHNLAGQVAADPNAGLLFCDPPFQTAMAVPLRVRETRYGVLLCASAATVELTDEDVMLFTHLGGYLATAVENEELLEQVQHIAALEERQRLARELHDSFGQILTYVGMRNLMISRMAQQGKTAEILAETNQLKQVLQEAHSDVRQSIFQLKESAAPRAPLASRWRQLLRGFEDRTGIAVLFEVTGKVAQRLADQSEIQLTRILQEALTNVRNHSGARSVTVRLAVQDQTLNLSIADDGCGFEAGAVHGSDQHHFGLAIMQERAKAVGGDLEVRSMLGHGTTVRVQMPLRGEEE